jgi:hypothetical protein
MRRILACVFLFTAAAAAQFTTATGTVTDPNGLPYARGTISAVLVTSATPKFTATNQPYTPPTQPVGLDLSGSFVMQLADNTLLSPGGTQWTFTVCSGQGTVQPAIGKGSVCFTAGPLTISGATQSITATLNASALVLALAGGVTLPLYLNTGTPTSQANECAGVTGNGSAGTVTAVAALRTIDSASAGHDVLCVVTSDTQGLRTGSIVLPFINSVSATSAAPNHTAGELDITGNAPPRLSFTNGGAVNRTNTITWRSCVGGCGTDWFLKEDPAAAANEDLSLQNGGNTTELYVTGNCPAGCATTFASTAGTKQFLFDDGRHDATVNPEFGLVSGHLAHGTSDSNPDNWGTATCSSSTATVTFVVAFSNATYKVLLTDQTTAGGARVSTKNAGSFVITCTGPSDSVDYLVLGNPF